MRSINVYCDESCYLENDDIDIMALGGVSCKAKDVRNVNLALREIKNRHGLPPHFEVKWTKVSPGKLDYFIEVVNYFLNEHSLRFRGVVIPEKALLDHGKFGQTHDDWYYKMYFTLLKYIVHAPHQYYFYLDIKDTHGGPRTQKLHEVLANNFHDFNRESIKRVQQIRSDESEILQLADLLIGAVSYANRGLVSSPAKLRMIRLLQDHLGADYLLRTSPFSSVKFNLLRWDARRGAS